MATARLPLYAGGLPGIAVVEEVVDAVSSADAPASQSLAPWWGDVYERFVSTVHSTNAGQA